MDGNTPLMFASIFGQLEATRMLLLQDADVTLTNKDGETAMSLAKKGGYRDIVALLRNNGALY